MSEQDKDNVATDEVDEFDENKDYESELEGLQGADSNDQADVPAALERETFDGKGGAVVPKADFVEFSEPDVENDDGDQDGADQEKQEG